MSAELGNRADVAIDGDETGLFGDGDARLKERARVAQLVADSLRDAMKSVVELGLPEYLSVEKVVAQGEAGAQAEIDDISADFPDMIADGSWRLDGIVAISDSNASADLVVTIAGLLPGISIQIKPARQIVAGGESTFAPIYQTIRAGDKPGAFGGIAPVVSGGAAGDKVYLSFVFRKVRDVRVQGIG